MKKLCATLSLALLGTSLVSGQMRPVHQFSVELKTTIFMPAGTNALYSFTNQFSVELGRSWWQINNRDMQNGLPSEIGGNLPSHMEAVGDYRSRTYQILRFENHEMPVAGTNVYGKPRIAIRTRGEVFPTPHPQEFGHGVMALWYAFCSGMYLEKQDHAALASPWDVYLPSQPVLASNSVYKAEVDWLNGPNGLPAAITFTSDGTYLEYVPDPAKGILAKERKYPAPFNKEFEIATYNVEDSIQVGNGTYPRSFSLRVSKPFETAGGAKLFVSKVMAGRVMNHSVTEEALETDNLTAHLPSVREQTLVTDYVAGRGLAVKYVATNRWELEGDEKLTDATVGSIVLHELQQNDKKPRWVIILFLVGVALMGVIGVRYVLSKKRNSQS